MKIGKYTIPSRIEIDIDAPDRVLRCLLKDENLVGRREELEAIVANVGVEWTTKRGHWPKRLGRALYELGVNVRESALSQAGQEARNGCLLGDESWILHITHDFNWQPGTYGDHDSCFWGNRKAARMLIENYGGIACLLHDASDLPIARCWGLPWTSPSGSQCWVLFNVYSTNGSITLTQMVRAVSEVNGFAYYRDIDLFVQGHSDGLLYVNSGAYVIGNLEVKEVESIDLDYRLRCSYCGFDCGVHTEIGEYLPNISPNEEYVGYGDPSVPEEMRNRPAMCYNCLSQVTRCTGCGKPILLNNAYVPCGHSSTHYCLDCAIDRMTLCQDCLSPILINDAMESIGGPSCTHCVRIEHQSASQTYKWVGISTTGRTCEVRF